MQGQTLRDLLRSQSQLPIEVATRLSAEIAEALDYAHRNDIVHRDIKPENILLHEGHAVVADFGIGKAIAAASEDTCTSVTQFGVVVGTPAYMSPEQASGEDVDGRSDLFSLGCMMYEMLTGEPPFSGDTAQATIAKRFVYTPPEASTVRSSVPHALSHTVSRLLTKSRLDRPGTGASVAAALRSGNQLPPPPRGADASVAVLPFTNMSADPDNEFFSDGMTDDVIVALSSIKGLKVAARASSFAFKGTKADLAAVGTALGVRSVLQGSVRRAGNRVRVTVQLTNAAEATQLWSERYDRDLNDIFAIQDDIARGIVEQLKVTLGLGVADAQLVARPTDDLEAYEFYLRGREAAYVRSPASLRRAIQFFREALARDQNYARAYLGLADAFVGLGVYQYMPALDASVEAAAALIEAERLRPDIALVHVQWAQLKLYLRDDWRDAGAHLDRALAIAPNEPLAHTYVALWNAMLGNLELARDAAARAAAADPLSTFIRGASVMGFPAVGIPGADSAAALAAHEAALAIDPNSMLNLWLSALRLGDLGRHAEALSRLRRAVDLTQQGPLLVGLYVRELTMAGRREEALSVRAELIERSKREYVGPGAMLTTIALDLEDEAAAARLIQANIDAGTGPVTIATTVVRELTPLLDHPLLGPLIRQLTFWATPP